MDLTVTEAARGIWEPILQPTVQLMYTLLTLRILDSLKVPWRALYQLLKSNSMKRRVLSITLCKVTNHAKKDRKLSYRDSASVERFVSSWPLQNHRNMTTSHFSHLVWEKFLKLFQLWRKSVRQLAFYFPLYESSTLNSPMATSITWKNTFWPTKRITQAKPYQAQSEQFWTPLRKFRRSFQNWRPRTFCFNQEATNLWMCLLL